MLRGRICEGVRGLGGEFGWRWVILATAGLALGCSGEPPLVCESAPEETVGAWSVYDGPMYDDPNIGRRSILGMYGSDGSELVLLQQNCFECKLVRLGGEAQAWVSSDAERTSPFVIYSYISLSEGHVVSLADGYGLALLDRSSLSWTQIERPSDIPDRQGKGWTGEEFVYWGAAKSLSESRQLTPETPYRRYYDGVLLSPETLEWTLIPPLREAYDYLAGAGGPSIASIWTSRGLFVWGTNPENTANFGAMFDRESMTWTDLKSEGEVPPLWKYHQLIALESSVYLFGGTPPGEEKSSRRLFEYSLDAGTWREIFVPEWVDPRQAAVVEEKLVFAGRCVGGALYDPSTDSWRALSRGGAPPGRGNLFGFGNRLAVTDVDLHVITSTDVWVLDLGE